MNVLILNDVAWPLIEWSGGVSFHSLIFLTRTSKSFHAVFRQVCRERSVDFTLSPCHTLAFRITLSRDAKLTIDCQWQIFRHTKSYIMHRIHCLGETWWTEYARPVKICMRSNVCTQSISEVTVPTDKWDSCLKPRINMKPVSTGTGLSKRRMFVCSNCLSYVEINRTNVLGCPRCPHVARAQEVCTESIELVVATRKYGILLGVPLKSFRCGNDLSKGRHLNQALRPVQGIDNFNVHYWFCLPWTGPLARKLAPTAHVHCAKRFK